MVVKDYSDIYDTINEMGFKLTYKSKKKKPYAEQLIDDIKENKK